LESKALPPKGQYSVPATRLSARVIARLVQAEACEVNPHYRADLRIARLTVAYAARGEAVLCSPFVLACYMTLGVHPDFVWPKIQERRRALEKFSGWELPPKKPPVTAVGRSQQKLWFEKTNGARVRGLRAVIPSSGEPAISVPMAAPPIAAAYPNSEAPSSEKRGEYSYAEALRVVKRSGAPDHVRELTIAALEIRGDWPNRKGPISNIITVSVKSLYDECGVWRSTIQRRIRRAQKDRFWRATRTTINRWLNCPKCGAAREAAKCPKCPHKGNGLNPNEFPRTIAYAIDLERFESTPPCRQVREVRELRARGKGGIVESIKQPAAEPAHRNPAVKTQTVVHTEASMRVEKAALLLKDMCALPDAGIVHPLMSAILSEVKYLGVGVEEAAKHIAECVQRDQQKGVAITRFYFRDAKWRSNGGGQTSAAQQRAEHNKRSILNGFARNARDSDPSDGSEREGNSG
jgi:hypothetical protein